MFKAEVLHLNISSLYHNLFPEASTQTCPQEQKQEERHVASLLNEKIIKKIEGIEQRLNSLQPKQRTFIIVLIATMITLLLFTMFSPIISSLALIILFEVLAILRVDLNIYMLSKGTQDEAASDEITESDEIDQADQAGWYSSEAKF